MNKKKLTGDDFEIYADGSTVTIVIDPYSVDSYKCIVDCYEAEKIKMDLDEAIYSAKTYEKNLELNKLYAKQFNIEDQIKELKKLTKDLPNLISEHENIKEQIENIKKDL